MVSADAAYTAGTTQRCTMTPTGRIRVGLSSAAAVGATAAVTSDLHGAVDPSGNQQPVRVNAAGELRTAIPVLPDTAAGDLAATRGATAPATGLATAQGSATSTSAQLIAARTGRRSVTLYNTGSVTVFVGASGVTTTTGFPVPAGSALTIGFAGALFVVTVSGTAAVSSYEVF